MRKISRFFGGFFIAVTLVFCGVGNVFAGPMSSACQANSHYNAFYDYTDTPGSWVNTQGIVDLYGLGVNIENHVGDPCVAHCRDLSKGLNADVGDYCVDNHTNCTNSCSAVTTSADRWHRLFYMPTVGWRSCLAYIDNNTCVLNYSALPSNGFTAADGTFQSGCVSGSWNSTYHRCSCTLGKQIFNNLMGSCEERVCFWFHNPDGADAGMQICLSCGDNSTDKWDKLVKGDFINRLKKEFSGYGTLAGYDNNGRMVFDEFGNYVYTSVTMCNLPEDVYISQDNYVHVYPAPKAARGNDCPIGMTYYPNIGCCYWSESGKECNASTLDKWHDILKARECSPSAGYVNSNNQVTCCPSGSTGDDLSTMCLCASGYEFNRTTGQCEAKVAECLPGYYFDTTHQICTICPAGHYCPGGVLSNINTGLNDCPTLTSGYQYTDDTGLSLATQCREIKRPEHCDGGYITKTATDATTWGTGVSTLTAAAGYKLSGSGENQMCVECGDAYYSTGNNGTTSCTACPAARDNTWTVHTTSTTATSWSACYETHTPDNCASGTTRQDAISASAYSSTETVATALSANPNYYVDGTSCPACSGLAGGLYPNSPGGTEGPTQCKTVQFNGAYIATAYATSTTSCADGYYKGGHTVNYGSTSSCDTCSSLNANYTHSGSPRTTSTDCYLTTTSTQYVASANGNPTTCVANSYCPGGIDVHYGSTGGNITCSSATGGNYTKSAAGASSTDDCYLTTTSGKYVQTAGSGTQLDCPTGYQYCTSGNKIYYSGTDSDSHHTTGVITACPTIDTGWNEVSVSGASARNMCTESKNASAISSYCLSGQLRKSQLRIFAPGSAATWVWTDASEYITFAPVSGAIVDRSGSTDDLTCLQCTCTPGAHVDSCTAGAASGDGNNICNYTYTCATGYNNGGASSGTFSGDENVATATSPACSVNSYAITVNAGNGISTVAATGWTNTGTASMSKSFDYGSTINLPDTVTPTYKNGYTGTSYAVTSGNCTINASNVVTVGAGACEITVNATGITAPTNLALSANPTTQVYNYSTIALTASHDAMNYDSSVALTYQFGIAPYSSSTCGSYNYSIDSNSSNTATLSKTQYLGTKCVKVKVTMTGEGGLTNEVESADPIYPRFEQKKIIFRISTDADSGEALSTGSTTLSLYSRYNTANLYTTAAGSTPGTIPTATKDGGYAFNGWYTAASGGSQVLSASNVLTSATIGGYTASSTWRNTANKNVYAQFTAMNVSAPDKTLTYTGSAQSCANVTVTSPSGATVEYSTSENGTYSGTAPTITNVSQSPITVYYKVSATGYTDMMGSYTCTMQKANCTVNLSAASGTITYPTANTTFTASSTSGGTLSVSPTATGTGINAIAAISNGTVTVTPQSTGSQTITVTSAATTNYNACSATYTATVNAKTITLKKNNGSGTCGGVTGTADGSMTCTYGGTCTAPAWNSTSCNINNGAKIFDGWATSASGAVAYAPNADLTNAPTTLYAHWTTPTCTVTNGSGTAVNTTTNTPKCTVTCNTGYHTSGTYTGTQNATSYSYTCEISSYTVTVKAGNGISTVAADGWTNTGTAQMNKSYNYNSTIDLSSVVTPTRKTGYTGTAYAVTSGNCTLSGSTVTVGAGNCEITVNATGLDDPVVSMSWTQATGTYNASNYGLDITQTTSYASGARLYYQFGETALSTDTTCGTTYTYTDDVAYTMNTSGSNVTKSIAKDAYHGYKCYKAKVYVVGDGGLQSATVETANSSRIGFLQRAIVFDVATNGGTLSGTSPRYVRFNSTNVYTTAWSDDTAAVPTATKAGYTFSGWYTAATGGSQVYNSSLELQPGISNFTNADSQWIAMGNKTLYAQFVPNTYTITYKTGNNTMATQSCTYGTTVTLNPVSGMNNIPVTTANGWSFDGWATNVNTRYRNYGDGATTYSCTGDATLYGIWKRTVRFVYFASATATGAMLNSTRTQWYYNQTQTEAYEHSVDTLPLYTIEAPRNWEPQGWLLNSTENTTTGISVQTDTNIISVTPAADVPAYYHAIYTRVAKVTYDGNTNTGGSTANTTCDQVQIWNAVSASPAPAASSPSCTLANNGFTKTGYTFNKWALGSASGTQYAAGASYSFSNTSVNSGDTVTMYATWTANTNTPYKVYHYTKDLTGAAYTQNGSVDNLTGTSDASVTLSTLTRNITGFTYDKGFAGTAATGTTMPAANTAVTTTTILPDGTRVISLYYNRNGYTITLNKNGGSGKVGSDTTVNSNPATMTCTYGDTVTLPAYNSTTQLTKGTGATSAVFRGWADNNDCTATTCAYTGVECTGDKTVYAVWIVPTCTAGAGVGATSLNSVSGNAPVCNKTASNGNYCTSATQTGTAGATSLTVTCTACPAVDSGYSYVSGTGWTSYSQCKEEKGGANCSGGKLTKTATSASAWGDAVSTLTAPAGSYVNGESCNLCATGSYTATAGTQTSCSVCGNGTTTNGTGQTSCNATCVNNNDYDHAWATPTWNNNNPTNICTVSSCKKGSHYATTLNALTDGYTELEYIGSTGTQYIDTGVTPTLTMKIETDVASSNLSEAGVCGNQWTWDRPLLIFYQNRLRWHLFNNNNYNDTLESDTILANTKYHVVASNGKLSVNGVEYTYGTLTSMANVGTLKLFYTQGNRLNNGVKIYTFKIFEGSSLVRNFIPAKRNSDGVLGMYDTVSGTFKTNSGSGTFVAGPALQGKNLFDANSDWDFNASMSYDAPVITFPAAASGGNRHVFFFKCQPNTTYTISASTYGDRLWVGGLNNIVDPASYTSDNPVSFDTVFARYSTVSAPVTFTTGADTKLVGVYYSLHTLPTNLQIEQGSTATDYQPYGVSYANSCEECVGTTYQATDGSVATACTACAAGYDYNTDNGKTAASMCQTNCVPGDAVVTANSQCANIGVNGWSAGGIVNYGSTTAIADRGTCPTGLTTTGSGTGADEAGDCGRILHIGNYSMRLRSNKKTSPSIMFDTDNNGEPDLYGNMTTTQKNMSSGSAKKLRVKRGNTTYYLYDDTAQ